MAQVYVELEYERAEDGFPVTLLAPLPTVRGLRIGGLATDLRLPGLAPDAVLATLIPAGDHFLAAGTAGETATLNGQPLGETPRRLSDGDVLQFGGYRLTLHEGPPPGDPPLFDTQLRWKLRPPMRPDDPEALVMDEPSRPYVEEFELSLRPLLQSRRFAEGLALTEGEIKRVLRLDEHDTLDGYFKYLWWTRVRMARESGSGSAVDVAREGFDLYADFPPLMIACGLTFLGHGDWAAAETACGRALQHARPEYLASVHDGRVGRKLIDALRHAPRGDDDRPTQARLELDAPGDEILLWRMCWYGRVFGGRDDTRFVLRRSLVAEDGSTTQHWEVRTDTGALRGRIELRYPPLPLVDPSILLEVSSLRGAVLQHDEDFGRVLLDWSRMREAPAPPVVFDHSAIFALPTQVGSETLCARLSTQERRVRLTVQRRPEQGDIIYRQGTIFVAVSPDAAQFIGGCRLLHAGEQRGFVIAREDGAHLPVEYVPWTGSQRPAPRPVSPPAVRPPRARRVSRSRVLLVALLLICAAALIWLLVR